MDTKYHTHNIPILCGFCILLLLNFFAPRAYAQQTASFEQGAFAEGEKMFRTNQPEKAIPLLQKALLEKKAAPSVYNYLGTAYMQTGNIRKALDVFLQGTEAAGTDKKSLYYNAGNASFVLADYTKAQEYFSLSLAADSSWAPSYLNRANTLVYLGKFREAIDDYGSYLVLAPDSVQGSEIRRMIGVLNDELAFQEREAARRAEEAERIKKEEERLQAERERIAAEKARLEAEKAAAEAERRKKLLEEVSAALQAGSSTNVSAGTEGVLDYEYEEADLQ